MQLGTPATHRRLWRRQAVALELGGKSAWSFSSAIAAVKHGQRMRFSSGRPVQLTHFVPARSSITHKLRQKRNFINRLFAENTPRPQTLRTTSACAAVHRRGGAKESTKISRQRIPRQVASENFSSSRRCSATRCIRERVVAWKENLCWYRHSTQDGERKLIQDCNVLRTQR